MLEQVRQNEVPSTREAPKAKGIWFQSRRGKLCICQPESEENSFVKEPKGCKTVEHVPKP